MPINISGNIPTSRSSALSNVRPDPPETGGRQAGSEQIPLKSVSVHAADKRAAESQAKAARARVIARLAAPPEASASRKDPVATPPANSNRVVGQDPEGRSSSDIHLAPKIAPATRQESVGAAVVTNAKTPPPVSAENINKAIGEPRDRYRSNSVRREHGHSGTRIGSQFPNYRFELKNEGGEVSFKVEISNRGVGPNGTKAPDGRSVMYHGYVEMGGGLAEKSGSEFSVTGDLSVVRDNVVNKKMSAEIVKYITSKNGNEKDGFTVFASDNREAAQNFISGLTEQPGTNGSMTQNFVNTINKENSGNLKLHSIEVSYPQSTAGDPSLTYRYKEASNSKKPD